MWLYLELLPVAGVTVALVTVAVVALVTVVSVEVGVVEVWSSMLCCYCMLSGRYWSVGCNS